jgi:hypothetical protein
MSATDHRRNDDSRTTILVASLSVAFAEIVGEMVTSGGFTLATMMQAEPAWPPLPLARVDLQASIEKLLITRRGIDSPFVLSGAGVTLEGGLVMHTFDERPLR